MGSSVKLPLISAGVLAYTLLTLACIWYAELPPAVTAS